MEFLIAVIERFIQHFPEDFRVEGLRYVFGAGGVFFLTWVVLGRALADRRLRKPLPARLRNKQMWREVRNSLITVVVFSICFSIVNETMVYFFGGSIFKIYSDMSQYGWAYLVFSVVLWSVGLDTYFYWVHRFMHQPKLYRFFHMTHHRSHNPTPFTAYSFAPPEAVLVYMFSPIFFAIVPMHDTAFIAAMLIQITRNAIAHCGYEVFPRGWASHPVLGIFATVTHHDMHHEKGNGNFGFYFTFWDRVMGTEHSNYIERFDRATSKGVKSKAGVVAQT